MTSLLPWQHPRRYYSFLGVEPYFQLPHISDLSKGNDCIICYFSIFGSLCLVALYLVFITGASCWPVSQQ